MEGRIGELLGPHHMGKGLRVGVKAAQESQFLKGTGTTTKQRMTAKTIGEHPTEVAEVIQEAEENEDIPTKPSPVTRRP